jgi:hypothetical protein
MTFIHLETGEDGVNVRSLGEQDSGWGTFNLDVEKLMDITKISDFKF